MWYSWTVRWWWLPIICQCWLGHIGCLWFTTSLFVNHCLVMFCLRAGIYSFNPCRRHSSRILHGKHFLMIIFFLAGVRILNCLLTVAVLSASCMMLSLVNNSLHSLAMRVQDFFTLVQNWFCPWCAFSHAPCLSKVLKKKQLNYLFGTWHIDWIISTKQFSEDIFGSGCLEKCYCIGWHSISVCASLLKHLWYC